MNKVKKNPHYVNNKDFHDALVAYNMRMDAAKENGTPLPRISNYLGECFLKIASSAINSTYVPFPSSVLDNGSSSINSPR